MRILFLGRSADEFRLIELLLSERLDDVEMAAMVSVWDPAAFGSQLAKNFDVVLLDHGYEWRDRALKLLNKQWPRVPIVVLAEQGSETEAASAVKAGASEIAVRSPRGYLDLPETLRRAVEESRLPGPAVSDSRLEALLERAGIGTYRASLDGRLLEASPACLALLEAETFAEAAALGAPDLGAWEPAEGAGDGGRLRSAEVRLATGSGGTLPARVTERLVTGADGALEVEGLVEPLARVANRGEAGEGSEGHRFALMVSHELRRPLRAARRSAKALTDSEKAGDREWAEDEVASLGDALDRMSVRLDDLARLVGVARSAGPPELFEARTALDRAIAHLESEIEAAGAEIRIKPLPTVRARPEHLAMLFENLISNALKYRGDQSPVIEIAARPEGEQWIFVVRDNGRGFDPERADELFEPFARFDPDTGGSGLGLAVSKSIVEALGGRIWADAATGEGAAFQFTVPLFEAVDQTSA